jgi:7-keto-8-aminopelargonate synthetase-like enzyme
MTAVENSISGLTKLALSRILEVTHRKNTMDFEAFFEDKLGGLHKAGNYRVFADIERHAGGFPRATRYRADGSTQDVTVWCSNDYLGMGQNPLVTNAMKGHRPLRSGRWRNAQHLRHQSLPRELEEELPTFTARKTR